MLLNFLDSLTSMSDSRGSLCNIGLGGHSSVTSTSATSANSANNAGSSDNDAGEDDDDELGNDHVNLLSKI